MQGSSKDIKRKREEAREAARRLNGPGAYTVEQRVEANWSMYRHLPGYTREKAEFVVANKSTFSSEDEWLRKRDEREAFAAIDVLNRAVRDHELRKRDRAGAGLLQSIGRRLLRPQTSRRGAGRPGGARRRVAAATTGGSSDDGPGEPPLAPIGARAGELADFLIAQAETALASSPRADLTAYVTQPITISALCAALILARDELARRGITWRWAPTEPQGEEVHRLVLFAERRRDDE